MFGIGLAVVLCLAISSARENQNRFNICVAGGERAFPSIERQYFYLDVQSCLNTGAVFPETQTVYFLPKNQSSMRLNDNTHKTTPIAKYVFTFFNILAILTWQIFCPFLKRGQLSQQSFLHSSMFIIAPALGLPRQERMSN